MNEYIAHEFKLMRMRELPLPQDMVVCCEPHQVAAYFRQYIETDAKFSPDCECVAVLMLNIHRKILGHYIVTQGTMDTCFIHPREVFRVAVARCAHSIIITHNHPSGESQPSSNDIQITRNLIRGGEVLQIEVLDHVVIGRGQQHSLRELGHFYQR